MWTGRQALASIESTLGRLRAEEGELDVALRSAAAEAVRGAAEAKVQATAEWRAAKAAFDAADAVARAAEQKAAASEEELGAKKKPYDSDPPFAYLWTHGFGTSRYHANRLVKLIDGRMANFIGFATARANYDLLLEIPQRLKEHAARQRAIAMERRAELSQVERRAMLEGGIAARERELA